MMFTFSVFDQKYGKFGRKNRNCRFMLKFGIHSNWNMHNSIVMFTFLVLDREYSFWTNWVQEIKIVRLSRNLVSAII